jgi:hypothetical protein
LILGVPSGQAVRSRFYCFTCGQNNKELHFLHANKQKMFTIFLKSGIITSKPSTEIEANNYDKTAS